MPLPKVTFFMMAYNAESYIEKSVRSVLNQTEKDINIFIINNGSTDNTSAILQKLQNEDSRIHFTTNKKNGVRDNGKEVFEKGWWFYDEEKLGEYISIIDSDDWIKEDFVEILYNKAKESNADITVGGTDFVDSKDNVIGNRFIPDMVLSNLSEIGNNFPILYNNFRTWWGKLFKKEFFFNNYEKAWLPKIQLLIDRVHYKIDTTIMMEYLEVCSKICCVSKTLYSCYLRENSMYSTRYPSIFRFTEAYSLYFHGLSVLKKYNLCTIENLNFMVRIHWAYIYENFNSVLYCKDVPIEERYRFLEAIANDDICNIYSNALASTMLMDIRPVLMKLDEMYVNEYAIYKSFMARLNRFIDLIDGECWHPCACIVIMSVLCDNKNKNSFGEDYIKLNNNFSSKAFEKSLMVSAHLKKWFRFCPSIWLQFMEINCNKLSYKDKKSEMIVFLNNNNLEESAAIAVDILEENPVDFDALICVIKYYYSVNDMIMGNLIKESMSVIWSAEVVEKCINEQNYDIELIEKEKWKL